MKAVLVQVNPDVLAERRRSGLDRWDEVWEGVLHVAPAPYSEHQRLVEDLIVFLKPLLSKTGRGALRAGINVFNESSPKEDYRIPDLTFIASGRESVLARDGVRGGGPDAVIEIRSPDDETYEKLPFFAKLGIREVVVIDRDTKAAEIRRLAGTEYVLAALDPQGWLSSEALDVRFGREVSVAGPQLIVQDLRPPAARAVI